MAARMTGDPSRLDPRAIETLRSIMEALRTPVTGCPWDLEQTFATIAPYTIEEAYEVADAINRGNDEDLREELGDLLLQVVYHSRMAEEAGKFSFGDVVQAICGKMIRRHPHVFGAREAAVSPQAAKRNWEEIKAREKPKGMNNSGILGSVPPSLPALTRAIKLQTAAAKVGFDWPDVSFVFAKIAEEIGELRAAEAGRGQAEEFGDLMFAMANLARHLGLDPESCLRQTNGKFERRFAHIERRLAAIGKKPEDSTLAEMDALWDEAKAEEALAPPGVIPPPAD